MKKLSIDDLNLKGKRVLVRVDFNVPIKANQVSDDTRIVAALPTIKKVIQSGAKAILMSHLGRPKGQKKAEFSLAPVAPVVEKLLGKPVKFVPDCVGAEVEQAVAAMKEGDVLLLENLRFYPEEEGKKGDVKLGDAERAWFIDGLARLADVYISDAFGTAHRKHASMYGVPKKLGQGAAGYLMQKEIDYFAKVMEAPEHPFIAVLGGAKVSDKIPVIENLLKKVDGLIIGGAMAYTFLKAKGLQVGASLVEEELVEKTRELLATAEQKGADLLLPVDHLCASEFPEGDKQVTVITTKDASIAEGLKGLDIGPKTIDLYTKKLKTAKTIIWNGPMGVFESKQFSAGTFAVAKALAESKAVTVIGGGDSVSAINQSGYADKVSHISTGGGASLELLEGKAMPGVEALTNK